MDIIKKIKIKKLQPDKDKAIIDLLKDKKSIELSNDTLETLKINKLVNEISSDGVIIKSTLRLMLDNENGYIILIQLEIVSRKDLMEFLTIYNYKAG